MNLSSLEKKPFIRYLLSVLLSCCGILLLFFGVYGTGLSGQTWTLQAAMRIGLWGSAALVALYAVTHPAADRWRLLTSWLLLAGLLLRVGYMLYTPSRVRTHDVGYADFTVHGHFAYILRLAQHTLPTDFQGQFYHPPLYHFLASVMVRIYARVFSGSTASQWLEAAKVVSWCAGAATLLLVQPLSEALRLKPGARAFLMGAVAFAPSLILMSGRVNNDALVTFFCLAILVLTLYWYRKPGWGNTLALAFCFGLGLMTKLSCGTMALVTGPVFLLGLIRAFREKRGRRLLGQLGVFALIAFPLGLWFYLWRYKAAGQLPWYVLEPSTVGGIGLYTGDASLWQRFGLFSLREVFSTPYCAPSEDTNLWLYMLRCSLFGEFTYAEAMGTLLPLVMVALNGLLILTSLPAMVYSLARKWTAEKAILLAFWGVMLGSAILFYLKLPYGCSMDFRYYPLTQVIGSVFLVQAGELLPDKPFAKPLRYGVGGVWCALWLLIGVFYCGIC